MGVTAVRSRKEAREGADGLECAPFESQRMGEAGAKSITENGPILLQNQGSHK